MRAVALAVAAATALAAPSVARAEPLPPGALQVAGGGVSGVGVDAARMGFGIAGGGQAAWQPMQTQQRVGWTVRWTTMFGRDYNASAARISQPLLTVTGDLTVGVRVRPGVKPGRYVTLRGGFELLRTDQIIPTQNVRDFAGPTASIGIDQYFWGDGIFSVDVRYGMIVNGPTQVALVLAVGLAGP
jgi:hypothetical protein